ncbi:MAG: PfkB family carbohydrate kinase, partial [Desulfobacteraceae bacterium]
KLPTGCVKVELDERGIPKFDILANVAYDNLDITVDIDHLLSSPVKLIYFGTLIQRTPKGFDTVQQILKKRHPTTQTFCDLNFRLNCYSKEVVLASLKQTDILKLNYEELMEVGQFIGSEKTTKAIITHLMKDYQINTITVTRGAEGSEWFNSNLHSQTDSPEIRAMVDTVGAGDAFAAATATGILKHWPVDQILNAASQFAAQICGVKGALPADDQIYEKFRTTPHKKG